VACCYCVVRTVLLYLPDRHRFRRRGLSIPPASPTQSPNSADVVRSVALESRPAPEPGRRPASRRDHSTETLLCLVKIWISLEIACALKSETRSWIP